MSVINVPSSVTILIDTREKHPLLFSSTLTVRGKKVLIRTAHRKLSCGDYAIDGYESQVVVERKGSMRELATNLLSPDRGRFYAALNRMDDSVSHPSLFLEFSPREVETAGDIQVEAVLDELFRLHLLYPKLSIIWAGASRTPNGRRLVGDMVARILITGIL